MRKMMALMLALLMALSFAGAHAQESGWKNILLLGGDATTETGYDRSDSMIILSINRDEALVKLTSVLRDTWVSFPGTNLTGKINAATVYGGPELSVATVNAYFGTDIEDYVIINMSDMRNIVDLMGGVDIDLTRAEANYLNLGKSGLTHLDGENCLTYCRIRSIDDDYTRAMRQQKVLLAMAEKAQNMEIAELAAISEGIGEIILTSLDQEEVEDLATAFMVADIEAVEQYRVPADGTFRAGMVGGVWRIDPDFEENAALLRAFIYD